MDEKKENLHKGHRQKVRDRFIAAGMDSMPDHNILEMLLFFGIPMKDTNELAHELIARFGSFSGVLQARFSELRSVKGMTDNAACLITMLLPIFRRYQDDLFSKSRKLETTEDIVEYILPKFTDTANERVFAVCFDSRNELICARQICEGDISEAKFELKKLASIVIETNASSIVLVHNHPNLIALASKEDVETTKRIYNFLGSLNVSLRDHIIIAKNGEYCSMLNNTKYTHLFYSLDKLF